MNKPVSSSQISRGSFVKIVTAFMGTVMGAIIGIPSLIYVAAPGFQAKEDDAWITLGLLEGIPIGIPVRFSFTRSQVNGWEKTVYSYGVFVVRQDDTQVRVFSNVCTHLGCRVSWHEDLQHYVSPCHDGHFDMLGNVVSGPPPRPLDEFTTKIEDGKLSILYPPYKRS